MDDLGAQTSYLTVDPGVPVYSSDGEKLGKVVRVMAAPEANMFDGIIFDTTAGPGGHKFVDAPEVDKLYERGVVLKIDAAEAAQLPKPSANAAAMSIQAGDLVKGKGGFGERLRNLFGGRR